MLKIFYLVNVDVKKEEIIACHRLLKGENVNLPKRKLFHLTNRKICDQLKVKRELKTIKSGIEYTSIGGMPENLTT